MAVDPPEVAEMPTKQLPVPLQKYLLGGCTLYAAILLPSVGGISFCHMIPCLIDPAGYHLKEVTGQKFCHFDSMLRGVNTVVCECWVAIAAFCSVFFCN